MVTSLSRPASLLVAVVLGGCAASTRTVIRPPQAPAVRCADPIEGVWEGEVILPAFAQWTRLRLEIRREPRDPTRLTGEIVSRYGSADTSGTGPPRCVPGAYDRTVRIEVPPVSWTVVLWGQGFYLAT